MRRPCSLTVLASAFMLMAAACDGLPLPALPARPGASAATDTQTTSAAASKRGSTSKRPAKVDPALEGPRFDRIQRALRRLVVAEQNFYAETGLYTDDLSRLGFVPGGETRVRFLWLVPGGWAASGTHPGMPGKDCVIFVGRARGAPTTLRDVRSGKEGVPVCDATQAVRRVPAAPPASPPQPPATVATPPAEQSLPDTGNALEAVAPTVQMRVDLRNLVRSQETYFNLQGIYSKRSEPFALQYLWHRGVTITILTANDASWSARATHAARAGKSCVIWLGPVPQRPSTQAQRRVPGAPATPICDD